MKAKPISGAPLKLGIAYGTNFPVSVSLGAYRRERETAGDKAGLSRPPEKMGVGEHRNVTPSSAVPVNRKLTSVITRRNGYYLDPLHYPALTSPTIYDICARRRIAVFLRQLCLWGSL